MPIPRRTIAPRAPDLAPHRGSGRCRRLLLPFVLLPVLILRADTATIPDNAQPPVLAALREAVSGHAEPLRRLLGDLPNPDALREPFSDRTLLHRAAAEAPTEIVALILDAGANPNLPDRDGMTALLRAAEAGRDETVLVLLRHGGDPAVANAEGRTVLHYRAGLADETIDRLLKGGAPPDRADRDGRTPLMETTSNGVLRLLAHGAEPRTADRRGTTPLHAAAVRAVPEIVRALLAAGADVDARDRNGQTALHLLCGRSRLFRDETGTGVLALLEAGADPTARDHDGRTPLHLAVLMENAPAIRALIDRGARADTTDRGTGQTVLHLLVMRGAAGLPYLEAFRDREANWNTVNRYGQTLRDVVPPNAPEELLGLLKELGVPRGIRAASPAAPTDIRTFYPDRSVRGPLADLPPNLRPEPGKLSLRVDPGTGHLQAIVACLANGTDQPVELPRRGVAGSALLETAPDGDQPPVPCQGAGAFLPANAADALPPGPLQPGEYIAFCAWNPRSGTPLRVRYRMVGMQDVVSDPLELAVPDAEIAAAARDPFAVAAAAAAFRVALPEKPGAGRDALIAALPAMPDETARQTAVELFRLENLTDDERTEAWRLLRRNAAHTLPGILRDVIRDRSHPNRRRVLRLAASDPAALRDTEDAVRSALAATPDAPDPDSDLVAGLLVKLATPASRADVRRRIPPGNLALALDVAMADTAPTVTLEARPPESEVVPPSGQRFEVIAAVRNSGDTALELTQPGFWKYMGVTLENAAGVPGMRRDEKPRVVGPRVVLEPRQEFRIRFDVARWLPPTVSDRYHAIIRCDSPLLGPVPVVTCTEFEVKARPAVKPTEMFP